jgi:hypothetical protein
MKPDREKKRLIEARKEEIGLKEVIRKGKTGLKEARKGENRTGG